MAVRIVIGGKDGKTYQKEISAEKANALLNLKIGDEFDGGIADVPGYRLSVSGGSDKDGFPMRKGVHGPARKRVLVAEGPGYHPSEKGVRKRKSIRGEVISSDIVQINAKVAKEGAKPLAEIFGKAEASAPAEKKEGGEKKEEKN